MSEMIKESKFLIRELIVRLERIEASDYDEELRQLLIKLKKYILWEGIYLREETERKEQK